MPALAEAVATACARTGESTVVNGRFKGGWITRHYGRPARGVHAIQMELAQRFYLDEDSSESRSPRATAHARECSQRFSARPLPGSGHDDGMHDATFTGRRASGARRRRASALTARASRRAPRIADLRSRAAGACSSPRCRARRRSRR